VSLSKSVRNADHTGWKPSQKRERSNDDYDKTRNGGVGKSQAAKEFPGRVRTEPVPLDKSKTRELLGGKAKGGTVTRQTKERGFQEAHR